MALFPGLGDKVRSFITEPSWANVEGMKPEDVARRRALAEMMMQQAGGPDPVESIPEGLNRVLQSFLAGRDMKAAEQYNANAARTAEEEAEAARLAGQQAWGNAMNLAYPQAQQQFGAPTRLNTPIAPSAAGGTAGETPPWLVYANQDAVRNQPLSPDLVTALAPAVASTGVQVRVNSGGQLPGQGPPGSGPRHDDGGAGDISLIKDGRVLSSANPADLPIIQQFMREAQAAGVTGFGAGDDYMGPETFHVGFGSPAAWGSDRTSATTPGWLTEALAPPVPAQRQAPTPAEPNQDRAIIEALMGSEATAPAAQQLLMAEIQRQLAPPEPPPAPTYQSASPGETILRDGDPIYTAPAAPGAGEELPSDWRLYQQYAQQETTASRQPKSFEQWDMDRRRAGAPGYEPAWDVGLAKLDLDAYGQITDNSRTAVTQLNTLSRMEQLVSDPNFYSGGGAGFVQFWRQIAPAFGGNPEAAAPMEEFQQLANQAVLDASGGSLGAQISNSDVRYLAETQPSLNATPEGNRARIEILRRLAQRKIEVAQLAEQWMTDHEGRFNAAQFNQHLAQWSEANPLFGDMAPVAPQGAGWQQTGPDIYVRPLAAAAGPEGPAQPGMGRGAGTGTGVMTPPANRGGLGAPVSQLPPGAVVINAPQAPPAASAPPPGMTPMPQANPMESQAPARSNSQAAQNTFFANPTMETFLPAAAEIARFGGSWQILLTAAARQMGIPITDLMRQLGITADQLGTVGAGR